MHITEYNNNLTTEQEKIIKKIQKVFDNCDNTLYKVYDGINKEQTDAKFREEFKLVFDFMYTELNIPKHYIKLASNELEKAMIISLSKLWGQGFHSTIADCNFQMAKSLLIKGVTRAKAVGKG